MPSAWLPEGPGLGTRRENALSTVQLNDNRDPPRKFSLALDVNADVVVRFKLIGYRAVTYSGDHGGHACIQLDEIFSTDRIKETLAESDLAELNPALFESGVHADDSVT